MGQYRFGMDGLCTTLSLKACYNWCRLTISMPLKPNSGATKIPAWHLIGIACRAGYGRHCLKIRTNAKKYLRPLFLEATTLFRCRDISSDGKRGYPPFKAS